MFMSPSASRKSSSGTRRRDDENQLIASSPTDSEQNVVLNGNSLMETPEVAFSLPNKIKTPVSQVVQSLRLSSKNYSELGSCPALNSGRRPLLARSLTCDDNQDSLSKPVEEFVQTSKGKILVARQGDPRKPALFTYPDIALNYISNFHAFFQSGPMKVVTDNFCIYHITPPGMESRAEDLPEGFEYPSLEELSDQVEYILHYYGVPHFIGLGVGLGANVLTRLGRRKPTMVDGLILINCNSQTAGWVEWVYHKVNIKSLRKLRSSPGGSSNAASSYMPLPESVVEYLIWYHMGRPDADGRPIDAVSVASIYRQHFTSSEVNGKNLALLLQSYMQRTDLNLTRELAPNGKALMGLSKTLQMQVLNMTGDYSPHVEATVVFNGRLLPQKCTWMKIQDAGMILEEKPAKVAEAVILFLQGLGYTLIRSRRYGGPYDRSVSLNCTPIKMKQRPPSETCLNDKYPELQAEKDQSVEKIDASALIEGLHDLAMSAANTEILAPSNSDALL